MHLQSHYTLRSIKICTQCRPKPTDWHQATFIDFTIILLPPPTSQHGNGTLKYENGDMYEGGFVNDHEHGQGKYVYADGGFYEGTYRQGSREGKGTFQTKKGDKYTGEFLQNKKHGQGELVFASASAYSGAWENDMMHGEGIYTYGSSRKRYKVRYEANQCKEKVPIEEAGGAVPEGDVAPATGDVVPGGGDGGADVPAAVAPVQPTQPTQPTQPAQPVEPVEPTPEATPVAAVKTEFPEWLASINNIDDEDRSIFVSEKIDESTFLALTGDDLKVSLGGVPRLRLNLSFSGYCVKQFWVDNDLIRFTPNANRAHLVIRTYLCLSWVHVQSTYTQLHLNYSRRKI